MVLCSSSRSQKVCKEEVSFIIRHGEVETPPAQNGLLKVPL